MSKGMAALQFISILTGIIGACAWIPQLINFVAAKRSKIVGTITDVASIKDFTVTYNSKKKGQIKKQGFLVILAADFFVYRTSFFARDCKINIELNDGKGIFEGEICNKINFYQPVKDKNGNVTETIPMRFDFPAEYNVYTNPLLEKEKDNIRIIPCLLMCDSDSHPVTMEDLKDVQITFCGYKFNKSRKAEMDWDTEKVHRTDFIKGFVKRRDI